jgi:hypothetical protein
MASADFCILTIRITPHDAVFPHFLSAFFVSFFTEGRDVPCLCRDIWKPEPHRKSALQLSSQINQSSKLPTPLTPELERLADALNSLW